MVAWGEKLRHLDCAWVEHLMFKLFEQFFGVKTMRNGFDVEFAKGYCCRESSISVKLTVISNWHAACLVNESFFYFGKGGMYVNEQIEEVRDANFVPDCGYGFAGGRDHDLRGKVRGDAAVVADAAIVSCQGDQQQRQSSGVRHIQRLYRRHDEGVHLFELFDDATIRPRGYFLWNGH